MPYQRKKPNEGFQNPVTPAEKLKLANWYVSKFSSPIEALSYVEALCRTLAIANNVENKQVIQSKVESSAQEHIESALKQIPTVDEIHGIISPELQGVSDDGQE